MEEGDILFRRQFYDSTILYESNTKELKSIFTSQNQNINNSNSGANNTNGNPLNLQYINNITSKLKQQLFRKFIFIFFLILLFLKIVFFLYPIHSF